MNESAKEFLTVARELLMGEHYEDACAHYYKVGETEPDNAEAEFFSAYLGYMTLVEERDGASAANAFSAMIKCIDGTVKCISKAEFVDDGSIPHDLTPEMYQETNRLILISKMVKIYTPITRYLFSNRLSTERSTIQNGVIGLYALGSAIEKEFGHDELFMKEAIIAWKEAVALQTQWHGYKYNNIDPDEYVAKIQKIDPTYTKPKKPGCISTNTN